MASPHYVGDDIVLSFVVLEAGRAIVPSSARVVVYNPKGKLVEGGNANIDANEVSYIVPSEVTTMEGKYMVVFNVILPGGIERIHPVEVNVEPLPLDKKRLTKGFTLDVDDAGHQKKNWHEILENREEKKYLDWSLE